MDIHVINGRRKKRRAKKGGKKRAAQKRAETPTRAKPVAKAKRRRTKAAAPARRRRRARRHTVSAAPARRRRSKRRGHSRHHNPGMGAIGGKAGAALKSLVPMLAGLAATAAITKRIPGAPMSGSGPSSVAGEPWSVAQYGVALAIAVAGGPIVQRFAGRWISGEKFAQGALALVGAKLLFTEIVPRIPGAQQWLGAAEGEVAYDEQSGQASIYSNGQWQALQGLTVASPLDGLEYASPLDGDESYGMGHLMPANTDAATATRAAYTGSGSTSAYQAAYGYR